MRTSISAVCLICLVWSSLAHAQLGPSSVIVNEVVVRSVAPVQTFVASVTPLRKSVVGSAVDGRVIKFLYDEEDPLTKVTYVTEGQPLAELRQGTIQLKVAEARAQRDLRRAEWEEAKETHPWLVEQAEARLTAAGERRQFARNQFERNRRLYEEGNRSVSREQYEQARSNMYTAEQQYIEAKINLDILKRGDRVRQAKARLDEAEAVLNELIDRVEKYTIRSPFDGFVVAEHTEVGAWITSGDPVADVVQLDPVEVRAFVPEKFVSRLPIGGKAIVRPNVRLMEDEEVVAQGKVTGIVAEAVTRSRTFPVKIQVDNPEHVLKAGMLAEVELEVGARRPSTMVPKDALVLGGSTPQIFLAVPDPNDAKKYTAQPVSVEKGASLGRWIAVWPTEEEIDKGREIDPGDLVVEKGNERLRRGAALVLDDRGSTPPPPDA